MESKVKHLRKELDELGYYQCFTPESTPLIEKLVADLETTTQSLQKYMKIAQNAIEERDTLQAGAEPYKCENAKLVRECNDLHLKFIEYKENNEKIQNDLRRQLDGLKTENYDWYLANEKQKNVIRQLETELVDRGEVRLGSKLKNPGLKTQSKSSFITKDKPEKTKSFEINSAMALADQKIANLSRDIKKFKEHNIQLIEANELLKAQVINRDKEIKRLNRMLEGGRSIHAIKKDCCCTKESHDGINTLQEQISGILKEKCLLESCLKESLVKQHEAMNRALYLAERNKALEKDMKDIDDLALAVEAECNNTVKTSTEKVNRLQDRMQESILQIQTLERENNQLKKDKQELNSDLDAITLEKKHLQTVLETSLDDKKRLTDRINNFTIIEHDLNMEIDRLTRMSGEHKRRIAELENSLVSEKVRTTSGSPVMNGNKNKIKKKSNGKRPSKTESPSILTRPLLEVPSNTPRDSDRSIKCCTCCCETCSSSKHLKELLDKELEYREQQAERCLETLKTEKEYYMKEYHKLMEQTKNMPSSRSSSNGKINDYLQKIAEKEQTISQLQHENQLLAKEKFNLLSRLDSVHETDTNMDSLCLKTLCKRTERERDLLRGDLERLEEERDSLKAKLKGLSDSQVNGHERIEKRLMEAEEQVRKLEHERRELVQNQNSKKAALGTLEDQCDTLKDQLRNTQNELNQQRALYAQLKTLHEQTDMALSDTQSKLVQAEAELAETLENVKKRDQDRSQVNREIEILKNDVRLMKTQLAQLDHEKDELLSSLDDKTEKMALIQLEIKSKDKTISALECTINDMKKKLGNSIEESANQEHLLRNSQNEIDILSKELDTVKKIKDSAIQENRKLQDELCSVACDCRDSRKELELYRRQVDDLKTQLQHYVAEVKRTEDLISNKEIERNEILDQFRSLSHEANILETNNHTLENEASQSRVQLSVALDHASDLERKIENKDSIIRSYEKQIADLTSQIASLEMQLRQFMNQFERTDGELQNMRDFCLKLENENTKFKRQLRDKDDQRVQLDRNVGQMRSERAVLQQTSTKDRRLAENVEKDLNDAKQETNELRLLNQDMQEEVQRLKIQVQELKDKFISTSEQLDTYQEKALEYSQQNKQLRREIANERFRRTRESESSKCRCLSPRYDQGKLPESKTSKARLSLYEKPDDENDRISANKNGVKSCITVTSPRINSLTANYTFFHKDTLHDK